MNKKQLKKRIVAEANAINVESRLSSIMQAPFSAAQPPKKTKQTSPPKLAFGLIVVLIFVALRSLLPAFRFDSTVYATISLDINPSLQIEVNSAEKVVSLSAFNTSGQEFISAVPFRGQSLQKVLEQLVQKAVSSGYIGANEWLIYLSVDAVSATQQTQLENRLTNLIVAACNARGIVPSAQEIQVGNFNPTQREIAQSFNISPAKYALIQYAYENTTNEYNSLTECVNSMKDMSVQLIKSFIAQNAKGNNPSNPSGNNNSDNPNN